jgi:hypothetical protein
MWFVSLQLNCGDLLVLAKVCLTFYERPGSRVKLPHDVMLVVNYKFVTFLFTFDRGSIAGCTHVFLLAALNLNKADPAVR